MKIFLIILFYLIYALISFVIVYANDTSDIANDDFEPYTPSIKDLSEEEREHCWTIDNYIKETICPRYHHQILKSEINYYQKENFGFLYIFVINASSCVIPLKIFGIERWWILSYLVALIVGFICYIVVWIIYNKYSTVRIKSYYEIHSSYDWHSHYNYLLHIKKNVIFRYMLRSTVSFLAFLIAFIIISLMY